MGLMRWPVWTVYAVAFLDLFSVSMLVTVLASYLREECGLSASQAGVITSLYGVVQFFSSPVAGKAGDKRGYGPVLLLCLLLCVPAYALLASSSPAILIFSRLAAGLFKHTQNLCRIIVAAHGGREEDKLVAYGRLNAIGNVGFVLGPALAAYLQPRFGYNSLWACISLSFALNAAFVFAVFPMDKAEDEKAESNNNEAPEKADEGLMAQLSAVDWSKQWDIMAIRLLLSSTALLYRNGFNWLLKDKFGVGPDAVGYLTSIQGTAAFLASFFASYAIGLYSSRPKCLSHVILLQVGTFVGFLCSLYLSSYAAFLIPFVVATSLMRVLVLDLSMERCGPEEKGLMVGVAASVVSVARAGAPALSGFLHDLHHNAITFVGLGLSLAALLISWLYTPSLQRAHEKPKKKAQ